MIFFRIPLSTTYISTDYLETVDANELLKCLGRAGVAQVQVWFSLDPVKVFPGGCFS